jgi:hypothetical protein
MQQLSFEPGLMFRLHKSELYGDHYVAGGYIVKRSAVNEGKWVAFCFPELLDNTLPSDSAAFDLCRQHETDRPYCP